MAGIKGRSGRKSLRYELKQNWTIDQLIDKSMTVIKAYLESDEVDINKKAFLASQFIQKNMTTRHETTTKIELVNLSQGLLDRMHMLLSDQTGAVSPLGEESTIEYSPIKEENKSIGIDPVYTVDATTHNHNQRL